MFLNADHPLSEDVDFYVEARTARGDTLFRYAPSVGTFDFVASDSSVRQNLIDNVDGLNSGNFPTDNEFRIFTASSDTATGNGARTSKKTTPPSAFGATSTTVSSTTCLSSTIAMKPWRMARTS